MNLEDWDKYQREAAKIYTEKYDYESKSAFAMASNLYQYYLNAYDVEDAVDADMAKVMS